MFKNLLYGMFSFENNTRKQTWLTLVVALVMWVLAGFALMRPNQDGSIPIADVVVLGAYFATIIAVILPIIVGVNKRLREDKTRIEADAKVEIAQTGNQNQVEPVVAPAPAPAATRPGN